MKKSGDAVGATWPGRLKIASAVALVVGTSVVGLVGSMLTAPARALVGAPPSGVAVESIEFDSLSESRIHGWWMPGEAGAGAVVLAHPLRANRLAMVDRARFLNAAGYSVLLYDAQAHGESAGEQLTFGVLEAHDARAAVDFARARVLGAPIGFLGCSMGGAAALLGGQPLPVEALVLEAVYPTLREAVENRIAMHLGPLGRYLAPLLLIQTEPRFGVLSSDIAPIDAISRVRAPLLIVAGELDERTTLEQSLRLFAQAPEPKQLWIIEGSGHVDFHRLLGPEYEQRVLAFLERAGL